MHSIIFAISFLFRKGQMRRVNNFSRNTSVRVSACFTKRVELCRRSAWNAQLREKKREETIVVHHVLLASSEFYAGGTVRYREPFITRNSFTSRFPTSLKFNDGAENIHSPRAQGNKWFTLATSGRRRNEDGSGGRRGERGLNI